MTRERASRQRFALVVDAGQVWAVAQITALTDSGDCIALEGQL